MSIKVKICGLSDEASVHAATRAGADFVGFVYFEKSRRHVSAARAGELKKLLPEHVKSVSVLVDPSDALLIDITKHFAPDYLQLHGSESAERVLHIKQQFATRIIKVVKVQNAADIEAVKGFEQIADMLMFDATAPKGADLPGGNGVAFDWSLLKEKTFTLPWFLSGGLTPQNVKAAIEASGASMVDVSSGVESAPGVKDAGKIESFIKAAKA